MVSNTNKISFSAQSSILADVDMSDVHQAAIIVDVDSIVGAPTSFELFIVPLEDQELTQDANKAIRRAGGTSGAAPAVAGIWMLGYRETTVVEPAFENVYKKIRVRVSFTGGTSPTITGSVYVFKKAGL